MIENQKFIKVIKYFLIVIFYMLITYLFLNDFNSSSFNFSKFLFSIVIGFNLFYILIILEKLEHIQLSKSQKLLALLVQTILFIAAGMASYLFFNNEAIFIILMFNFYGYYKILDFQIKSER